MPYITFTLPFSTFTLMIFDRIKKEFNIVVGTGDIDTFCDLAGNPEHEYECEVTVNWSIPPFSYEIL